MDDKPRSEIKSQISQLMQDLHIQGHTRKEIVHYLREVADYTEGYWEDHDSYDRAPSEKNVVLPGDSSNNESVSEGGDYGGT